MQTDTTGADERRASGGDSGEISLLDIAIVIAENLRLLVIWPLLAGVIAIGVTTFAITPTFTAKVVMLPPQQQQSAAASALQSLGAIAGIAGGAAAMKTPADQYVALMRTNTVEDRLIDRFKLLEVYEAQLKTDARRALEQRTRINTGKKDGLITVEVDDTNPQRAADIANAYVDELGRLTSTLAITEAQRRRLFFEQQLTRTTERLASAQRALQSAGINEGAIRAEPRAATESYARLQAEVTAGEVRLQTMRGYLAETAPEFQRARSELAALRTQLAKREAVNASGAQGDYVDRFREFKYQETLFELFSRQYEVARIDESREGALIQVVDAATPPERRNARKRATIAAVTTLGTLSALLLFVWSRHWFRRARGDEVASGKLLILKAKALKALGKG